MRTMPETRWEHVIQGIAYTLVVVFMLWVGAEVWHNVTANPVQQVREFEQRSKG